MLFNVHSKADISQLSLPHGRLIYRTELNLPHGVCVITVTAMVNLSLISLGSRWQILLI